MSRKYSVAEARAQLSSILDEVESGADVELTRRGKAVAVLLSIDEYERLHTERGDFRTVYKEFLKNHRLSEVGVDNTFSDKIRDRSTGRKVTL